MEINTMTDRIISEYKDTFQGISAYLFHHPELGGEEYKAVSYLTDILKKENFDVTFPCRDLPTAFVARSGSCEGPTFCFLAEYDALPGYGPDGEPGHACGHNWIAAAMTGTGIVLSKLQKELNCNVCVAGTPAEETFGGKADMVSAGVFDEMDICMQAHLDSANCMECNMLAMNTLQFTFHGKASHAGSFPENGINALDAVITMFQGINQMRQHFRSDSRIHGIITKGGDAANIVPETAQCIISFRASTKKYLEEMRRRVINIAKGAELITGAAMEYTFCENPFDHLINVPSLIETGQRHFEALGYRRFIPYDRYPGAGSTDLGNVSQICPTLYFEVDLGAKEELQVHDPMALKLVNGRESYDRMAEVIKGFVCISAEIASDPALLCRIKKEHAALVKL